ncbi:GNAT family N-acetyltransferase [Streptomyces sp. NRRL F-5126]|uniref:GNAT family N-acetyltransferase n=1 Tax=Streptomyces sp. NRRL F-5126 TaxID=1463857 RepID=UPI001F460B4E|nr:GNAT family N-acetyltransferase [Streptomyces sp. NRRL F-5126]
MTARAVPSAAEGGVHSPAGVRVRAMGFGDCAAVAAVRVGGWRFAYEGMMPRAFLEAMSVEADTAVRRAQFLAAGDRVVNLVAERAGEVVGWGCWGPARDEDAPAGTAELYALYVRPGHVASGVGRALMAEVVARAVDAGSARIWLWVAAGNARARRFYGLAGFAADGAGSSQEYAGVPVPEVRYARELSARPAAAASRG